MFIGEQPGDKEDLAGHPFVGPAGRILDEALEAAGIDRDEVYVTNAVKHFSWVPDERGKRRIHAKRNAAEIAAIPDAVTTAASAPSSAAIFPSAIESVGFPYRV